MTYHFLPHPSRSIFHSSHGVPTKRECAEFRVNRAGRREDTWEDKTFGVYLNLLKTRKYED